MARKTAGRRGARRGAGAVPVRRPTRRRSIRWLGLGIVAGIAAMAIVIAFGPSGLTKPQAISILSTSDFHALAFSPTDRNVVYFGHHNGVLRSGDGGRSWTPLVEQAEIDAMGIAFPSAGPNPILLAGHNGLQISSDSGISWTPMTNDLPSQDIHALSMNPDDPRWVHAFVIGRGLFVSSDSGVTWLRLAGDQPLDVLALASGGGAPERLYLSTALSGLLRSIDGGATWTSVPGGPVPGPVFALAVDSVSRAVYAGASDGLYRSTDGGDTWKKLSYPGKNARSVGVSPSHPNTIVALSMDDDRRGLLYRSEDGGSTWVRP